MFVEPFHYTIMDIHLALEVKTSFANSMPTTGSSTDLVLRNLEFPPTTIIGITRKKRRRTCTQKVTK
jgi:hypothetical protein